IGLSKIPRIVDMFARRLQLQERMTGEIGQFINLVLEPEGIAVVVEGLHLCSMIRGVQKHDARMTTSCMLGRYGSDAVLRKEFYDSIARASKPLTIGG
ncbi:MAG: GTP cyclohydrolase I, partial [Anaerolineaceae bacterium]